MLMRNHKSILWQGSDLPTLYIQEFNDFLIVKEIVKHIQIGFDVPWTCYTCLVRGRPKKVEYFVVQDFVNAYTQWFIQDSLFTYFISVPNF